MTTDDSDFSEVDNEEKEKKLSYKEIAKKIGKAIVKFGKANIPLLGLVLILIGVSIAEYGTERN